MISVIAKIPVQEGKFDEVVALFKEMLPKIAQEEEGTLAYSLNKDQSDPNTVVMIERYRDKAAMDVHASTPYFKEFSPKLPPFLAGKPEIVIMEELDSI